MLKINVYFLMYSHCVVSNFMLEQLCLQIIYVLFTQKSKKFLLNIIYVVIFELYSCCRKLCIIYSYIKFKHTNNTNKNRGTL